MLLSIALITISLIADDQPMDLESLSNVMEGLQAGLEDVEFVYEGGVIRLEDGKTRESPRETFQGNFAFRSDGSVHIDLYVRNADLRIPLGRRILCLSNRNNLEEMDFQPDRTGSVKPKKSHGGLPSFNKPKMPLRLFIIMEVMEFLRDTGGYRTNNNMLYECLGWENVNNFRCLKIRFFSKVATSGVPKSEYSYWLDMYRGGTPIKREFRSNGKLWARTEDIELAAFKLPSGQSYWLPIRGVLQSFLKQMTKTSDSPTIEETYNVVNGTVIFNQKLPDNRFTIDWRTPPRTLGLQVARAEHEKVRLSRKSNSQMRLEETLTAAAHQERELEASAPSRESWSWTTVATSILCAFGILIIVFAYFLKLRAR